jgi:rfaE bifunctional protein kinase chain/domain
MNKNCEKFESIIERFPSVKIGVVGDMIADVFIYGTPSQLSREAPVVIVKHESQKVIPGGAANTVNNLLSLGAQVMPIGLVGDDDNGDALLGYFKARKIDTTGIITVPRRNTITKMRIMAGRAHTSKQQVVRVDYDPDYRLNDYVEKMVINHISAISKQLDAIIVSDYHYDLLTPNVIRYLCDLSRDHLVIVDSHYRLAMFKGVALITPNEQEALLTTRHDHDESFDIFKVGRQLHELIKPKMGIIITQGNEGMIVFENDKDPVHIPIVGSDDVTDVTGAGDTVVSTLTLALCAGADLVTAAHLANYAAAIVVMKSGTATTNKEELMKLITRTEYEQTETTIYS